MSEPESPPKSRLEAVNVTDPTFDALERRGRGLKFLPFKMQVAIGVAFLLLGVLTFEDFIFQMRFPHEGWVRAGIFAFVLLLGAAMRLADHFAMRRRRASKRAPTDFG